MKAISAATFLFVTLARAEVTSFAVLTSETDPAIKTFQGAHWIYLNRDIVVEHKADLARDRHELLLWIPGTQKESAATVATREEDGNIKVTQGGDKSSTHAVHKRADFHSLAADLGYHVIGISYPNDSAAAGCREDSDPNAFERFRMAIIQGGRAKYIGIGGGTKTISIERSESIEYRLIKLLQFLKTNRPKEENWGQFLNEDDTIKWEAIAVGGLSQGGGHAALIAIKHQVARVICTGAPKDFNKKLDAPAAWYRKKSATPKGRFFAFNHHQDNYGCTPQNQLRNLKALRLEAFGPPAEVDNEDFPYHHARILYTDYPVVSATGEEGEGAIAAHVSLTSPKNLDHWKQVWTYLLTEKTP